MKKGSSQLPWFNEASCKVLYKRPFDADQRPIDYIIMIGGGLEGWTVQLWIYR